MSHATLAPPAGLTTADLVARVDGILVEKPMGFPEAFLAAALIRILGAWVHPCNLGAVAAPAAMMRLAAGLVRLPGLSPSNTRDEIERKRRDYFNQGTQRVWLVDPRSRTAEVFTAATVSTLLHEPDTLDGGAVLPGFTLPVRDLFAELDPH